MVLVRKHEELAGHFASLKHVEHRKPLGHGQTIVELTMNNLKFLSAELIPYFSKTSDGCDASLTSCGVAHLSVCSEGSHFA